MIRSLAIFLSLFAAVFAAGCGNASNTTANTSGLSSSSPTPAETLKEYVEAARSRDLAKMRQTSSKKSIEFLEEILVEDDSTLEEAIRKNEPSIPAMFESSEVRNEKIMGNRASIEVKSPVSGEWLEVPFIMEDGRWKLAIGEQFEESIRKGPPITDFKPNNSNERLTTK